MNRIVIVLAALLFVLAGCTKNRKSEGLMDDPQTHYMLGKRYMDKGEVDRAVEEFNLAKSLDKKYGPAYAGLAIAYASKGDIDKAEELVDDAMDLCGDKKDPTGLIAMGRVLEYKYKGSKEEKWFREPQKYYRLAIEMDPKSGEAYYRAGHTYKIAYEFRLAEDAFRKVLELKNGYEKEADEQWQIIQKINRAAPGTRVGMKIALIDKIQRADIAALFINELELDRILEKRKAKNYDTQFEAPADSRKLEADKNVKMADIVDIKDHWARNFIMDIQKFRMRGLEPGPDHKFNPSQEITRGEYAFFIEDILIAISGDKTLATKHIGADKSRFPDVNPSSPYYNAVCNAVDMNIMDANIRGEFAATESVSGPDALLVIRKIKELRR